MDAQEGIVVAAGIVSVAALCAVVFLATALRRTQGSVRDLREAVDARNVAPDPDTDGGGGRPAQSPGTHRETVSVVTSLSAPGAGIAAGDDRDEMVVLTRDGRAIVLPSTERVVGAALGRPLVRGATFTHGVAHALRPESRDRVRGLVRREFRHRRKQRLRAGRRAARAARLDTRDPT
jgi:hypothetical protein